MRRFHEHATRERNNSGAVPRAVRYSMSPSRIFILRPVATTLLMVGVLLVGWVAFMQLPVSALPEVDYPTIQVVTFYPGADPDVMASSVTSPLERQFGQVPGLSQMTSTSSFGSSDHHAAIRARSKYRRRRAAGASRHQCGADVSAFRSAESSDLQQGESGRCSDSDAGIDVRIRCHFPKLRISPILRWRRRFRNCPALAWSRSAVARSRRYEYR